jgi:uncharacterized peroxidase-related enzyme
MARLPIQNPETATGTNKNVFDGFQKALGVVPNMVRVMGNSPALLNGYAQFSGALSGGKLSAGLREQLALVTAEANSCDYCLSAHSAIGKLVGLKPEQIEAARQGQSTDPKIAAGLQFAQRIISTKGGVNESDIQTARQAGFSDAELAEIVGAVALNVLTNYFNRAFAVDVDFPRVSNFETVGAH